MTKYPKDWVVTSLEAIGAIKSGGTPLRSEGAKYFSVDGISWVKTMDLNNGYIEKTDEKITKLAIKESACSIFPKDTVLVAMYGGFNQIGRTGILTMEAAINQAISAIILKSEVATPEYVIYWLNANVLKWRQFAASSRKDPNITRKDVCEFPIVLPPLLEQCRIAEILGVWDESIDLLEKLIGKTRSRKQGLMQQLLTGKKRFKEFEGSEWKTIKIRKLMVESRIHGLTGLDARKITVKLYCKGVFAKDEKRVGSENTNYFKRKSGQFIYSKLDFLNGAFGIVPDELDGYESTLDLPCFDFTDNAIPKFIFYFVGREEFYSRFKDQAIGGRKARRVSPEEFLSTEIKIPSLLEQAKIAAVLSAADDEISTLEKQLAAYKQQELGLMQQLLTGKIRVGMI